MSFIVIIICIMKHKRTKTDIAYKCNKYIVRNDLPRLKSYIKKHAVDISSVRLQGDNTLLHCACHLGHDAIVCYLLKKDADCLLMNAQGDLPIHVAVRFALTGSNHAYTDLVLPLMQKCRASLDIRNADGVSCRVLLQDYKHSISAALQESDSDSSVSEPDIDDTAWTKRLNDEMADEFSEQYGTYDQDDYYAEERTETWDQWAERINRQYSSYKQNHYHHQPAGRKRHATNDESKRPEIPKEKQRRFQENLQRENEELRDERNRVRNIHHMRELEIYRISCAYLFGNLVDKSHRDRILLDASKERLKILKCKFAILQNDSTPLEFNDIPWPVKTDSKFKYRWEMTEDLVVEFLLKDQSAQSEVYKKYLKDEQRRWHPDRFLQKCGTRLADKDREKIVNNVTKISQIFNRLLQDKT